ncbi:MAG: pilus assembly protein TadG-related protein [Planctomycetota bacterium]
MSNSNNQKRRGIAIIWVAMLALVLIGFAGLLIDMARIYITAHQLHNAADAASLAGSRIVPMVAEPTYAGSSPEQVALSYAQTHTAGNEAVYLDPARYGTPGTEISSVVPEAINPYDVGGDILIGRYIDHSRLFVVDHTEPDSMLTIPRRDGTPNQPKLPLLFGPIFGIETVNVKRYAIAKIDNPYGAGLLALSECPGCPGLIFGSTDPHEPAIAIFGGGSLYVNSYYTPGGNDGAVDQSGNAEVGLDLDRMYVVGSIDDKFDYPPDTDVHDYTEGVEPEPDPYAHVPDAVYDTSIVAEPNISVSGTYSPGYYPGGIQVSGTNTAIELLPGDYYLDSVGEAASMSVNGGLITGEGVTLHIVGDAGIGINVGGNANIDISAPTEGPYAGIGIFQKRDPDYNCAKTCFEPWQQSFPLSEFNGTGDIIIDGAVYMPHNKLELGGNGYIYMTRTVADRFYIYGSGEKIVDYKGDPQIANKSYLVE